MSSYSELESLRTVDLLRLSFNRTPLKNASVGRFFFLISRFFSISTSWILRAPIKGFSLPILFLISSVFSCLWTEMSWDWFALCSFHCSLLLLCYFLCSLLLLFFLFCSPPLQPLPFSCIFPQLFCHWCATYQEFWPLDLTSILIFCPILSHSLDCAQLDLFTRWLGHLFKHKFTIQLTFYIPNWTLTIISGPKRKILNLEIKCNSVTWTVYVTVWHNPGSLVQTLSDIIMFKNTFLYTLLLTFLCFFALVVDF